MTLMSDSDRIYFPSRPSSHQIPLPFNHSDPAEVAAVTAAVAASSSSFSDDRECKYAYEVHFRCSSEKYLSPDPHQVGDIVIVSCDRGYNIGFVNRQLDSHELLQLANGQYKPKKIIAQLPQPDEKIHEMLRCKIATENYALEECRTHCQGRRIGALADVLGAEFQFDRKKLTIFIKLYENVSVCRLVRRLYDTFKMRVKVLEVESVDAMEQSAKRYLELSKLNIPMTDLFDRSVLVPKPLPLPETTVSPSSPPLAAAPTAQPFREMPNQTQQKVKQSSQSAQKKKTSPQSSPQIYPIVTVVNHVSHQQQYPTVSYYTLNNASPQVRNLPQQDRSTSGYSYAPRYRQQYNPCHAQTTPYASSPSIAPPLPMAGPAPRKRYPMDYMSSPVYSSHTLSNGSYLQPTVFANPPAIQPRVHHSPSPHFEYDSRKNHLTTQSRAHYTPSPHFEYDSRESSAPHSHASSPDIYFCENEPHRHWAQDFSAPYQPPPAMSTRLRGPPASLPDFEKEKEFYYDQRISPLTIEEDDYDNETIQSLIASLTLPKRPQDFTVPMFGSNSGDSHDQRNYY